MDLKSFDTVSGSQLGHELELLHPATREGIGVFITILGKDSAEFTRVQTNHNRLRLQKMQKGVKALTTKELEKETMELVVVCTKAWRQVVKVGDEIKEKTTLTVDGEELECTPANAEKFYTRFPDFREQVDAGIVDRANFLPR